MEIMTILFYLFATLTVLAGLAVITARNPVYSVFFLIVAFFNAAALLLLIGAEYIAMTLVIVYVGAVAVLFLFVVMMLNINLAELRQGFLRYLPLGVIVGALLLTELYLVIDVAQPLSGHEQYIGAAMPQGGTITNTQAIGLVLYTQFAYPFQMAGLVLLVAMIGAIVLILRTREGVRRQNIRKQNTRKVKDSIELVKIEPGQGA